MRQDDETSRQLASEAVRTELAHLRWLLVQTMDGLAEGVLAQIQATRRMVDQTETLLENLASTLPDEAATDRHSQQVSAQIEAAMRELPESVWNDFGRTCTQLADMIVRLHAGTDLAQQTPDP